MHIEIINPNSTAIFTDRLRIAAQRVAAEGTRITACNPLDGPAAVESHTEEALAAVGVLKMISASKADAHVIACFGDTGLHGARELARGPIVGMTEAALFAAAMVASRFAIVTLPSRTRAHSDRVLRETGLDHRCTVHAVDIDVGALEDEAAVVAPVMIEAARRAMRHDHAEALILGCAGLSELVQPLTAELGIPVIDGVLVGVKMAEALLATGLSTSRFSTYARLPGGLPLG